MTELEHALSKLSGVKRTGDNFMAQCPCHDDKNASLSLKEVDGKLLLYCHAGCSFDDIVQALGLKSVPLAEKTEVTTYDYVDASGNLQYQVVRYEPKDFRQRRPDGNDGWVWDLHGVQFVLYNLPAVKDAVSRGVYILFVEGEKDVHTLAALGVTATTTGGGSSGKWKPEYTEALRGAKVAIIADNDDPGRKYATRVADSLYGYVESLKWIELPELDKRGDVTDWLHNPQNDRIKLAHLLNNAPEYTPPSAVSRDEFDSLRLMVKYLSKEIKRLRYSKPRRKDGE